MNKAYKRQVITSAPVAAHDEASARTARYLVSMAIRLVCIALAILITPHGWYSWLFIAGAAFLPTFGVIVANVTKTDRSKGEKPIKELEQPSDSATLPDPVVVIDIAAANLGDSDSHSDSGETK